MYRESFFGEDRKGSLPHFFSYYGGKHREAKRYPRPKYNTIIEPFAGSAGYSTLHASRNVLLYDKSPVVCGVWEYLIRVKESEFRSLPLDISEGVDPLKCCQEAKWLIGFWINTASSTPHKTPSKWMRSGIRPSCHWGVEVINRLAPALRYIRHWKVENLPYDKIPNIEATWFVDPPYIGKPGKAYPFRLKEEEYIELGRWCRKRTGQVIVCERTGAEWLPFRSFGNAQSNASKKGKRISREAIWIKELKDV
jgi:site-specific DNA-adenine methylase